MKDILKKKKKHDKSEKLGNLKKVTRNPRGSRKPGVRKSSRNIAGVETRDGTMEISDKLEVKASPTKKRKGKANKKKRKSC